MTDEIDPNDTDCLAEDPVGDGAPAALKPWRVLVVDDVADVHAVTRLALGNVTFRGRGLEILSAYSGAQGFAALASETDIALVLLDVVMETDDAGLRLAKLLEVTHDIYRLEPVSAQAPQTLQQVGALFSSGTGGMLCVMQKSGETARKR